MKKISLYSKIIILLMTCLLLLSGCWSRRELNFLAIVEGFGVDQGPGPDKVIVSHQIVKPDVAKAGQGSSGGNGGSGSSVWNLTTRGQTLFDAIRKGALKSSRRLYYGHNKIIVIGEETAKGGVSPYLDLAGRDPELRPGVWIFIARGATAEEIINAQSLQNPISSNVIDDMAKVSRASSYAAPVKIEEFLLRLNSEPTAVYAPGIIIDKRIKKDGQEFVEFKLSGTAVFSDDKLIGWLNEKETRGMLWILGKITSGIIVVKSPDHKNIGLEIVKAKSKIKPQIKEGKLSIAVEVEAESNLGDSESRQDLVTPENYAKLIEHQCEAIEGEIRACLEAAQKKFNADLFGFGQAVHQNYPQDWKMIKDDWEEIFPTLAVELKVTSNVNRYGMIEETAKKP